MHNAQFTRCPAVGWYAHASRGRGGVALIGHRDTETQGASTLGPCRTRGYMLPSRGGAEVQSLKRLVFFVLARASLSNQGHRDTETRTSSIFSVRAKLDFHAPRAAETRSRGGSIGETRSAKADPAGQPRHEREARLQNNAATGERARRSDLVRVERASTLSALRGEAADVFREFRHRGSLSCRGRPA